MQRIPVLDVVMSTQLEGRQEKQWVCTELRCSREMTTKGSLQENAATGMKRTCLIGFLMLPTTRQKQNFSVNWLNLERKEGTGEEWGQERSKRKGKGKEEREWRGREVY